MKPLKAQDPSLYAHIIVKRNSKGPSQWVKTLKTENMATENDKKMPLDRYDFFAARDRCFNMNRMIQTILLQDHAIKRYPELKKKIHAASELIGEVAGEIGNLEPQTDIEDELAKKDEMITNLILEKQVLTDQLAELGNSEIEFSGDDPHPDEVASFSHRLEEL